MNWRRVVEDRIGSRTIVWFSARSHDAEPVLSFGKRTVVVSLVGSIEEPSPSVEAISLEHHLGRRVDYNRFSFDDLGRDGATLIAAAIESRLDEGVLVWPFFSSQLSRNLALLLPGACHVGNPPELQRLFEHKPWVETELQSRGIRTIQWRYSRPDRLASIGSEGPLVVRPTSGTGGASITLVSSVEEALEVTRAWPADSVVSLAPFIENTASVNITAAVRSCGSVALYPMSTQLIGTADCTTSRFGYCGNDFATARPLSERAVDEIEQATRAVGQWMASYGFLGAFGVDYLVDRDEIVHFVELNPRLQGSSHLGSLLMREAEEIDVYTDHLAAHLGVRIGDDPMSLRQVLDLQTPVAQLFGYSDDGATRARAPAPDALRDVQRAGMTVDMLPEARTPLDDHALLFRLAGRREVLDRSGGLAPDVATAVRSLRSTLA